MWTAQHSAPPSHISAKNVDLHTAIKQEQLLQPVAYSRQTEMWVDKHPTTSSTACDVPPLSPHSLTTTSQDDVDDDDARSQDTDSTACSMVVANTPKLKEHFDVDILLVPGDEYEETQVHTHDNATAETVAELPGGILEISSLMGERQKELRQDPNNPEAISLEPTASANSDGRPGNSHIIETLPSPLTSSPESLIGRLKEQLLAVTSKITILETNHPTIMASDYAELQRRIAKLEAEKMTLSDRHEALFGIRDTDLANLVNVRALLAHERREHEETRKLRDGDLANVIELRDKLAHATWSNHNNKDREEEEGGGGRKNNILEKRHSSTSIIIHQSNNNSNDLWQIAKMAALEQRVLELESANAHLRGKLELLKSDDDDGDVLQQQGHRAEDQPITTILDPASRHRKSGMIRDALFDIAMRHRERCNADIEELRAENRRLKEMVSEKEVEIESVKVLLEMNMGLR